MAIEIKRLRPELANDFFYFFEMDAHADNPNEEKCYCVNWVSASQDDQLDFSTAFKRKGLAQQYINEGTLQGYLAYEDNKVVGWCNANTKLKCVHSMGWQAYMSAIPRDQSLDDKIKSIYCFAIAPQMKRKGVASSLLEVIIRDAKAEGFMGIEAFPIKSAKDEFMLFMGPIELYKKNGFEVVGETERDYIMRLNLDK